MYGGANDNKSDGLTTMWNAQRDRLAYQYRSLSDGDGSWYSMRGNVDYQRTSKKEQGPYDHSLVQDQYTAAEL